MTGILPDEEIDAVSLAQWGAASAANRAYARAIEAAVLAKLSAGVSVEPDMGTITIHAKKPPISMGYSIEALTTAIAAARARALEEAAKNCEAAAKRLATFDFIRNEAASCALNYRADCIRALIGKEAQS